MTTSTIASGAIMKKTSLYWKVFESSPIMHWMPRTLRPISLTTLKDDRKFMKTLGCWFLKAGCVGST